MRVSAVSFAVVVHLSHATRWCDSGALRTPRYRAHGRGRRQHQAQPVHTGGDRKESRTPDRVRERIDGDSEYRPNEASLQVKR